MPPIKVLLKAIGSVDSPVIVVAFYVCAQLSSSNSVHYLLWCCVQSMFSIIAVYVFLCLHISITI